MKLPGVLLWRKKAQSRPITLLGRAVLLVGGELLANAVCWIAAGICLSQADGLLGLALLAWTIGLRHGLDADHISAIDNATRQLVSLGQLPITCGLWFSLGHSTIVIVTNIAIAIRYICPASPRRSAPRISASVDIYDRLDNFGSVGGIIGASVSASFLFLIACINIYFLTQAIRERRRMQRLKAAGLPVDTDLDVTKIHGGGCLVRMVRPILKAVDRPWKMYPVGVLFGLGFDTASSIALLAISAIAQRGPNGEAISHGKIVILPFLFTAGMSLVDSLDSILMLYAYATPSRSTPEGKLAFFSSIRPEESVESLNAVLPLVEAESHRSDLPQFDRDPSEDLDTGVNDRDPAGDVKKQTIIAPGPDGPDSMPTVAGPGSPILPPLSSEAQRVIDNKFNVMSNLSITLTLLSILVALSISLITIMGLIGENCAPCQEAAEAEDGGGLAGSWWRGWAKANDESGYIGAAIVGCFAAILLGYHGGRWIWRKYRGSSRRVSLA